MNQILRTERPADQANVYEVNRLTFGREDEARLVDALRAGGYVRLSLVAECDGRIVGHLLFSALPIVTRQGPVAALSLAPLAVLPEFQRRGIGSQLVREGLKACRASGHVIVVVLGHPAFYARLGFSAEVARPLESPFTGEAWMAMELRPGALAGVKGRVQYPPPFGVP
jgi:putative acetyltransferase